MEEINPKPVQGQPTHEPTPDQKGAQDLIGQAVKTFAETSLRSKDYYKFIIGLATGTLVFSSTFTKELLPSPEYKLLLAVGWFGLLVCVLRACEKITSQFAG